MKLTDIIQSEDFETYYAASIRGLCDGKSHTEILAHGAAQARQIITDYDAMLCRVLVATPELGVPDPASFMAGFSLCLKVMDIIVGAKYPAGLVEKELK